jgi:hypothetical protein|tara:strand:+ start:8959 stop:9354 length:396 start_codon:yes stop_codon:yes gene_type:complete
MSKVSKEELKKLQELAGIYSDVLNEKDAGSQQKVAIGHIDNERDMIRRQLYQMGTYCVDLSKMLKDLPDSDFPNWWQAKITKAGSYISDAKHYLENSLAVPPGDDMAGPDVSDVQDPDFERDDVQDPSGVS